MSKIAKAIVAAATAGSAWIATATHETDGIGGDITSTEWGIGACAVAVAFFLVWAVPNADS